MEKRKKSQWDSVGRKKARGVGIGSRREITESKKTGDGEVIYRSLAKWY